MLVFTQLVLLLIVWELCRAVDRGTAPVEFVFQRKKLGCLHMPRAGDLGVVGALREMGSHGTSLP